MNGALLEAGYDGPLDEQSVISAYAITTGGDVTPVELESEAPAPPAQATTALATVATPRTPAQAGPAWQRFIVDPMPLDAYPRWLAAERQLLTDLDCYSADGRFETLRTGQHLQVEAIVIGSDRQQWTPLFFGFGGRCYIRAEFAKFLDSQSVPNP